MAVSQVLSRVSRHKTVLWVLICLVLLAGGGWWGWRLLRSKTPAAGENVITVRLGKVARGDLAEVVQAPGDIEPRHHVSISAKVSARLIELPHDEGSTVTKGNAHTSPSLLVRLDATDLEAAVRSAKARYAAQQAQIKVGQARIASARSQLAGQRFTVVDAERDFARERNLMASRNTSQQNYDQAKRKVDELHSQFEAAEHSLEADDAGLSASRHNLEAADAEITRAQEDLRNANIVSPIDGIVTRVNAKVGEMTITGTMNNAGTVILEVADLSQMLLVARIDEADIASVRAGQSAEVHMQAFPNRVFKGKVTKVALASKEKEKEKNFIAEVLLETNGERIPSGLTGDVDIETSRHTGVLKVPSQAVQGRPVEDLPAELRKVLPQAQKDKSMATLVCRFEKGKAQMVPVAVGPSDVTHTIITSGLNEGDQIIIGPYKILESLKHDQKVKDEKESTGTKQATDPKKSAAK
ncbi:MAG: efflux RND transporter periplasmic adaptor subunit [Candidatus Sumerlaeaceae bacterium]